MPKVTYDAARGLIQEAGSGIQFESNPFSPVQNITGNQNAADVAVGAPGIYKFASGFAHSASMPLASDFPGGVYVFRAGGNFIFALTGSAEAAGTKVFAGFPRADGTVALNGRGSKISLPAVSGGGTSVTLMSDGVNYVVLAASGSYTISGA